MIWLGTLIVLNFLNSSCSSSNFSIRVFRAYPLVELRQTAPCRAIRGSSVSVNSALPSPLLTVMLCGGVSRYVYVLLRYLTSCAFVMLYLVVLHTHAIVAVHNITEVIVCWNRSCYIMQDSLRGSSVKTGTTQIILAASLRNDDTHTNREV